MRILVTGGGGFSGRRLVALLEACGDEVHTVGTRLLQRPRHHHIASVTDHGALREIVTRVAPDQIFHLAGLSYGTEVLDYYRVNVGFGAALLTASEEAGHSAAPLLLVGSSAEYGQVSRGDLPIPESLSARPYGHYGISKLAQTVEGLAAGRRGRPVVVARPFNLLGAGMPGHLVAASFARQIADVVRGKRPAKIEVGNLDASRDFLHVDDAVAYYVALLRNPDSRGEIVNICSGASVSIRQLLTTLIGLGGVDVEVRTSSVLLKQMDIPDHYGSAARLHQLVAPRSPRGLDTMLRDVWAWAMEGP
jgi:nucleoside-diphosphate-sugar epimerase